MIERHLMPALRQAMSETPVTMLVGPRQSGKSTLAQALVSGLEGARYVTLDRGLNLAAAREDPAGFLAGGERTLVIDEVQRAPDLLREIKASVDRDRRPGRFVLTGSADVLTLPGVAETLAGRIEVLRLWPLSQGEIVGRREAFLGALMAGEPETLAGGAERPGREELLARIVAGGFPEALGRSGAGRARCREDPVSVAFREAVEDDEPWTEEPGWIRRCAGASSAG